MRRTILIGIASLLTATAWAAPASQVDIRLFMYQPAELNVTTGTEVIWTNHDAIEHSVSADIEAAGFGSGLFTKGEQYSYTFTKPGDYPYHCSRHPSMQGVVRVRTNDR
jgi:plastocyanin